jgi:hypothetical protein
VDEPVAHVVIREIFEEWAVSKRLTVAATNCAVNSAIWAYDHGANVAEAVQVGRHSLHGRRWRKPSGVQALLRLNTAPPTPTRFWPPAIRLGTGFGAHALDNVAHALEPLDARLRRFSDRAIDTEVSVKHRGTPMQRVEIGCWISGLGGFAALCASADLDHALTRAADELLEKIEVTFDQQQAAVAGRSPDRPHQ